MTKKEAIVVHIRDPYGHQPLTPEDHKALDNLLQRLFFNQRYEMIDDEDWQRAEANDDYDTMQAMLADLTCNFLEDTIKPKLEELIDL